MIIFFTLAVLAISCRIPTLIPRNLTSFLATHAAASQADEPGSGHCHTPSLDPTNWPTTLHPHLSLQPSEDRGSALQEIFQRHFNVMNRDRTYKLHIPPSYKTRMPL